MGLLDAVTKWATGAPRPDYMASPFSESTLTQLVYSDLFGVNVIPVSRLDAMTVPANTKARGLVAGTIAQFPLTVLDLNGELAEQPSWTYRTDGAVSPFDRMLWTLDDLAFYGQSLWAVKRGAEGQILSAARVPYEQWSVDPEGRILYLSKPVDDSSVLYFRSPQDALLDIAARSIAGAISTDKAWTDRVQNPIPAMEIHETTDNAITTEEARGLVADYNTARSAPGGTTVFTPAGVELRPHGTAAADLFVEGRNASRIDLANFWQVPVALLDGSTSTASLTYSTAEGRRNEFLDYGLSFWMRSIEGRLSQDDVVPRGQRVRFDTSEFLTTTPNPTAAPSED